MKAAVFDGIPDLTGLVDVSVYDTKPVHFPSMCCNAIKWVQKTRQVYDPKQRWYMTLTFCVWIWMTRTIITWNRLTAVINFGMCTKLTTGCVSTSSGDLFSFGDMAPSLSMHKLFTKHFVKRARCIPWAIMSFSVWFAWRRLNTQNLAAKIIWFRRFDAEASGRRMYLHWLLLFQHY